MTNIVYSRYIVRADSYSDNENLVELEPVANENLQESEPAGSGGNIDELEENLVQTNQERLEVKGVVLSVIRRACFGIGRTVSLIVRPGLSSEFEKVVAKQDDPISDGSGSGIVFTSKVASASGGHSVSFSVSSDVEIWSGSSVFEKSVNAGWPSWLLEFSGEALKGWTPRKPDSFRKLARIGDGKDSLVYKARDILTGKIVALRKFLFTVMPESVKSMSREVLILRRLDHPNVVKLEGLVTSRNSYYAYLIFEYMEHDMTGLSARPGIKFTVPQVKCYIHQLISGLEHCHNRGVVHSDIQRSNLLLNNQGMLKIAGFGSASLTDLYDKQPMTGHVGTLYYRSPELLLGAINYGIGVDLWSTGCILADLLAGKPIMRGCTEVDQLHQIFKLFGSPTEKCWGSLQLRYPSIFKPIHPYTRCIEKTFQNFPRSSLQLIETLLAFEPAERQTATTALRNEFFTTEPYACEPSSLPQYPPSTEMAAKLRHKVAQRVSALSGSLIGELQIEDSMFWPCRDNNVDVFSDTAAIKTDTLDDTIGISTVSLDDIINRLLKVRTWKPGKQFHLSEAEIHQLCTASREIFLQQPNLLELEAPINICGNIHGHYSDLLRLFDYGDLPHKAKYLFLGNYVDHGNESLETMCLLLAYKVKYPDKLFLLRGNHECASDSKIHRFYEDCRYHFGRRVCDAFNDCFDCLPVAAIVADKIFCVSGGLSPDLTSLDQIRNLTRPTGVPMTGLLCDLIWSDPSRYVKGWGLNDRGISYSFGSDKVSEFLTKHDLGLICRSHQVMEEVMEDGYEFFADRQLVTIFSASNYCGELDNSGAMMSVDKRLVCSFKVLKPGEGTKVKK